MSMIQLYDKMPPEFCGGGMLLVDRGKYCKAWDAQKLLNREMAKIQFLQEHIPEATHRAWSNYKFPHELRKGMVFSRGVAYCNAWDAQRLLNSAIAEIEFLKEHIPTVDATIEKWARHKPVRC